MIKIHKKNKKGFTLVEMIVVISIIIILSGILIPKVLGYQDKAKKAKVVNTARQIYEAAMTNYTENEGAFAADLSSSITSVTDLALGTSAVNVPTTDTTSATVKFSSDGKDYTVEIAAKNNRFDVLDGSSNQIYTNK